MAIYPERSQAMQRPSYEVVPISPAPQASERVVYNSLSQAVSMGRFSGVEITPELAVMYELERVKPLDAEPVISDQVLMAGLIERTGGPVEVFKRAYPNIFSSPSIK